jgi:hypothetical protein
LSGLLILAPALFLIVVLGLGFFPGEKVIARVRSRWSGRHRSTRPAPEPVPASFDLSRRIRREIARAVAVRPPPRSSFFQA